MKNKKFNVAIEIPILETPENPGVSHIVIYAKTDGKIYTKTSIGDEIGIIPDYITVETLTIRDALPLNYLKNGIKVYVVENDTEYRYLNDVWEVSSSSSTINWIESEW